MKKEKLISAMVGLIVSALISPIAGLACEVNYEKSFSIDLNGQPGSSTLIKIATADFDVDGTPDIAATEYNPGKLTILLGDGVGGFTSTSATLPPFVTDVETGDFNRDRKPDLLIGFYNPSVTFMVLLGNGHGGFTGSFMVDESVIFLTVGNGVIGDFNRDKNPDFAFSVGSVIKVYPGNGQGGFGAPIATNVSQSYKDLATADMNRDGRLDFVLIADTTKPFQLAIFAGTGDGSVGAPIERLSRGADPQAVSTGDFQSDGDPDVFITEREASDGTVFATIFLNIGNGVSSNVVSIYNLETAIFTSNNNDGLTDLIGTFGGKIHQWNGRSGPLPLRLGQTSLDYGLGIGNDIRKSDLNGDGRMDVIVTDSDSVMAGLNTCL